MIKRIQIKYGIAAVILSLFMPLAGAASDIDAINKKQEISQMLKELRELRKAKYTLINEWKDEKAQLELMIDFDNKKIDILNETIARSTDSIAALNKQANQLSEQNDGVNRELVKLSEWIDNECRNIINTLSKDYPILITEEHLTDLKNIVENEMETTLKIGQFLNSLQTLSLNTIKPYIEFREIDIKGKTYGADVIRLGGALEYFVTPDAQFGGVRTNHHDSWTLLDAKMNEQLREIIKVIRKETDAKLVTIPVPSRYKKNLIQNN